MDKIKLTKRAKEILRLVKCEDFNPKEGDNAHINLLEEEGLIDAEYTQDGFYGADITSKGEAYLLVNPKLRNPSIWDDRKYWITTGISFAALALSIYASFIK